MQNSSSFLSVSVNLLASGEWLSNLNNLICSNYETKQHYSVRVVLFYTKNAFFNFSFIFFVLKLVWSGGYVTLINFMTLEFRFYFSFKLSLQLFSIAITCH